MTVVDASARWLPFRGRTDPDALPLLCLPHAGGGASAYGSWLGRLPGVAVLPVQPPGREARFREPAYTSMASLVADLATVILDEVAGDRPYALYGHSHGGLVGYELLQEVRRRGGPLPVRLFVSGCAAPHLGRDDGPLVSRMSRPELVHMLRCLGGTPEWLLSDDDALDMVLPAFVGDFAVRESWAYEPEPPLAVPLTVLAATDDPRATHDEQSAWRDLCTGPFDLRTLTGGHFAVFEQVAATHRVVAQALAPWT